MIDLGHWVQETYRVPGEPVNADDVSIPRDDDLDG